jgi:hypothetical protein
LRLRDQSLGLAVFLGFCCGIMRANIAHATCGYSRAIHTRNAVTPRGVLRSCSALSRSGSGSSFNAVATVSSPTYSTASSSACFISRVYLSLRAFWSARSGLVVTFHPSGIAARFLAHRKFAGRHMYTLNVCHHILKLFKPTLRTARRRGHLQTERPRRVEHARYVAIATCRSSTPARLYDILAVGIPRIDAISEMGAIVYRHFCLPQSSSSSRLTAGASEFFILSQSGERPER